MSIRTFSTVKKNILKTPIVESCEFQLGDKVTFTNDYGVVFSGLTIIGFDNGEHICFKYGSHIYLDTEAHWFPHKDNELTLEKRLSPEAYLELTKE